MWGIIATWRMAVEGISKASQVLAEGGDAGDAIENSGQRGRGLSVL